MEKTRLIVFTNENYVKLDEIKSVEESLQKTIFNNLIVKIDIKKPQFFVCAFDETRVEF